MACLVPRPDIEANLLARDDGHTSMNCLLVSTTVGIEVHPEDGASLKRLESDTFGTSIAITFNEVTPLLFLWHRQTREMSPTANTISLEIHHKAADSPRLLRGHAPVVVECIVSSSVVSLSPQSFDEGLLWPALERQCSLFNALNSVVPLDSGLLGLADAVVHSFDAFVTDSGYVPIIFAGTIFSVLSMRVITGPTSIR